MRDRSSTAFVFAHFDDSVLSAFSAIAECDGPGLDVVVFGGASAGPVGAWDRECGFATSTEAAQRRRHEHLGALSSTSLEHVTLNGLDAQYSLRDGDLVQDALWSTLESFRPSVIVTHMADAYHDDHRRVSSWVRFYARHQPVRVIEAGDRPYHVCRGTCEGGRRSVQLEDSAWTRKQTAVAAYRSQSRPLAAAFGPEWASRERLGWECYRAVPSNAAPS